MSAGPYPPTSVLIEVPLVVIVALLKPENISSLGCGTWDALFGCWSVLMGYALAIFQEIALPFLVDLRCPSHPVGSAQRQVDQEIAQRGGMEDVRIIESCEQRLSHSYPMPNSWACAVSSSMAA